MRLLVIVDAFPVLSQTFVLRQITGLMDRGFDIDILAGQRGSLDQVHPEVASHDLLARTRFAPDPAASYPLRLARAVPAIAMQGILHPLVTTRLLDGFRHGRRAISLRLFLAALPLLESGRRYDAICCHFGDSGDLAVRLRDAGALASAPVVTFFYGHDLSAQLGGGGHRTYDYLLPRADLCLPVCDRFRGRLLELGADPLRTHVHRVGVDCSRVALVPPRAGPRSPLSILSVARLVEKKGLEFGLRALARLRNQHGCTATYRIVGDGPLRAELEAEASRLGVSGQVEMVGARDELETHRALCEADVLLAPSITAAGGDEEGTPVAILDAMARGRPAVASRSGAIPEIIVDGEGGFLEDERDVDGLASRLAWLDKNRRAWPAIGQAARARIESAFDLNTLNDSLALRLHELVEPSSTPTPDTRIAS